MRGGRKRSEMPGFDKASAIFSHLRQKPRVFALQRLLSEAQRVIS